MYKKLGYNNAVPGRSPRAHRSEREPRQVSPQVHAPLGLRCVLLALDAGLEAAHDARAPHQPKEIVVCAEAKEEEEQRAAARVERAVRTEVPAFLGFGPTTDQLRRACAAQRIVVTLGELSDEPRQAAARVLADRGAAVIAAPGSAHVPQVEAPAAYAAVLATVLADPEVA